VEEFHSELSRNVRRRAITAPREDKEISPEVLHRIRTYIGDTSNGPVVNRLSHHESKGRLEKLGTFTIPKKTDTKMEIVITGLVVMGYTVKSIAENSKALFGVELNEQNIRNGYKRVLWNRYNKDKFLNKVLNND